MHRFVVMPAGRNMITILRQFAFYNDSPRSAQVAIEAVARRARLRAGAVFYSERAPCTEVALVGSGSVRVFMSGTTGREITLYHVHGGETCLVNMMCAFLSTRAPANAHAETALDAIMIPAESFRQWVRTSALFQDFVIGAMADRVINLMTLVEEIAFSKMDRRLGHLLLERFVKQRTQQKTLKITHEEIAAELGSAREVVSRLLKDFEHGGAIKMGRGQIMLRDEHLLHRRSES